jgi:hypothetical protein
MPETRWPLDQGPNVGAITTKQVIEQGLPILLVTHYADDHSWAFVCGTTDLVEDGRVIAMKEALRRDPTLLMIADLPPGTSARRERVASVWLRCN